MNDHGCTGGKATLDIDTDDSTCVRVRVKFGDIKVATCIGIENNEYCPTKAEALANAHMLVASKPMYEALELLEDLFYNSHSLIEDCGGDLDGIDNTTTDKAMGTIRAALLLANPKRGEG